ncbi:MAG: TolC family protein [Elusimicrobiota bacterium]
MVKFLYKKLAIIVFLLVFFVVGEYCESDAEDNNVRVLTIDEFIERASNRDTNFEEIMTEELKLNYSKDLQLPAGDIILSVKSEYQLQNPDEGSKSVSLEKLFPYLGAQITAQYSTSRSELSDNRDSQFSVYFSQPVARNAFGRTTRIRDKIIGAETELAKYQITEAYEDYLAIVITAYYNWYFSYENVKIGESSYQQSLRLLENIKQRRKNNIALPIDVNKVNIQVLAKKENLVELEEEYQNLLNKVKQIIRYDKGEQIIPVDPFMYKKREIDFEEEYKNFKSTSRTYSILNLLEEKTELDVKKEAGDILPSANLLLGVETQGKGVDIKNSENDLYAGLSFTWPFPSVKERAELRISEIEKRRQSLSNENKYLQLDTDLKNLFLSIQREKKLISIADEKISLAESVLEDERENYSYGRVSLNDYIAAVNIVDQNRFSKLNHSVRLKILMTEWLRITDQLIN